MRNREKERQIEKWRETYRERGSQTDKQREIP